MHLIREFPIEKYTERYITEIILGSIPPKSELGNHECCTALTVLESTAFLIPSNTHGEVNLLPTSDARYGLGAPW